MAAYNTLNRWGGNSGQWVQGGTFVIGCRGNQGVVGVNLTSNDGGKTFTGQMTYAGEGPIDVQATQFMSNNYQVENKWGSSSWQPGGNWVLGARSPQPLVGINVSSNDDGQTLTGNITYEGEGPIDFQGTLAGCTPPT
ncbi:MAG TPA: hypothetical protein VF006_01520 [Longimicrobium sp.]